MRNITLHILKMFFTNYLEKLSMSCLLIKYVILIELLLFQLPQS